MPYYDFVHCKKKITEFKSFDDFDRGDFPNCPSCGSVMAASAANSICVYGTDRYSDDTLKDASEASGMVITNTKQVDKLEKQGKMYRITNPSAYRTKNDKNHKERNKKYSEKLRRCL